MTGEFNFLIGKGVLESDKRLFFGKDETEFIVMEDDTMWFHVLVKAGVFESNNLARKNGWNKPIENGFTDTTVGKKRTRITILKILEPIPLTEI